LDYEQPTVNFCDIEQDIFGPSTVSSKKSRKLGKTTLLVDENDESEAIDDDETWEWMDESPDLTTGKSDFGPVEVDADLDTPELEDVLADAPVTSGGREVAEDDFADARSEESDDSGADWHWES
jgi:hypothetical protein